MTAMRSTPSTPPTRAAARAASDGRLTSRWTCQTTPTETWLVAHDLSPCSDAALEEAARRLASVDGQVIVVTVHPPVRLRPEEAWGDQTFLLTEMVRARLHDLAVLVSQRYPCLALRTEVVGANDVVRGILEVAARLRVDHIVVGTHDRRGLAHLVFGSVSRRVVAKASVPVTVVRAQPEHRP